MIEQITQNMPRVPYPFPRYENDDDFSCSKRIQAPAQHLKKLDASENKPWNRLYETKTLASVRRDVFHHDPQAPHDSLDFVIKSAYDHHQEFLKSMAETLFQPETVGLPHGRVLKNRGDKVRGKKEVQKPSSKKPVLSIADKRENIHSINGAIPSHHSASTNRGYSRKHDGGFYGC